MKTENKMKTFKKISGLACMIGLLSLLATPAMSQEETESPAPVKEQKPVRTPFNSAVLVDNQTYVVMPKGQFEFMIQHRFGTLKSESFDLFGLYAPSNIRLGLTYGLAKNLQVGIGTTKNNMLQDLNWKYKILTQTRSNSMPFALTYYGNVQYDAREKSNFGVDSLYKGTHRLAFFNELILGRKFSSKLTMQVSLRYAHYNQIDSVAFPKLEHSNFGLGVGGRFRFSPQGSVVFEYDQPLTTPDIIKPNIAVGFEIATSSHSFQIFITRYNGISPQKNMMFNTNQDFLLGFNITRNWNF